MHPWAIVPLPSASAATALAPVAGESPLSRVVRATADTAAQARIVVVGTAATADGAETCLRAAGLAAVRVVVASGPGSRRQLVAAGLTAIGADRDSRQPVLLCDCGHPLAPPSVAARVAAALSEGHDVALPTLAVTDTVKTVDALGAVLRTVDRTTLRTVQYPRGFAATALWDLVVPPGAAAPAIADDLDELGAAMRAGLDVVTVDGDPRAFQVELPRDTRLLEAIIAGARG